MISLIVRENAAIQQENDQRCHNPAREQARRVLLRTLRHTNILLLVWENIHSVRSTVGFSHEPEPGNPKRQT